MHSYYCSMTYYSKKDEDKIYKRMLLLYCTHHCWLTIYPTILLCGVAVIHYCHWNVIINIYNYKAYNVFQYCKFQRCIKIHSPCSCELKLLIITGIILILIQFQNLLCYNYLVIYLQNSSTVQL